MASIYRWNKNPFQDFLLRSIIYGVDISDKGAKNDINTAFSYILGNILENRNDVVHLDFEITKKGDYFKLVGKNAVSAMWLSGIIPYDTQAALTNNVFIVRNKKYVFDNKTKKLTYTIIHE
jgi:hypothetical protein